MKWYIPSWNGDLRLEPHPENAERTLLSIIKPTPAELVTVNQMGKTFEALGWLKEPWQEVVRKRLARDQKIEITAPLEKVGPLASALMRPGKQVLTAVRFKGGLVETVSGQDPEALAALAEKAVDATPDKPAEAAVTVKRPTPSCPACIPGANSAASEVLLAFLSEIEHESWQRDRCIFVEGGLSGNRYRLSHRHSRFAQQSGRMCVDLDDRMIVHFHDWTVPPEEEVLAAKLILEHREPWLRNEATMLAGSFMPGDAVQCVLGKPKLLVFKNPFGDGLDGVRDAFFTDQVGRSLEAGIPIGVVITKILNALSQREDLPTTHRKTTQQHG